MATKIVSRSKNIACIRLRCCIRQRCLPL